MTRVVRLRLRISGIVQGVGFRPWVYNLAVRRGLNGFVLNSTLGVTIEVEGANGDLDAFIADLAQPPALAEIAEVVREELPTLGDAGFVIRQSDSGDGEFVLVPPDIATCPDCLADIRDPTNRRYQYPFTNCTNCGPRYSVIRDIPYDRAKTTMVEFTLCAACQEEYENPQDRRFHAEPNACPVCGPSLELWDGARPIAAGTAALQQTRQLLTQGRVVAIKGLGGFHLACDASSGDAVGSLRARKHRSGKPFALMFASLEDAVRVCEMNDAERAVLDGARRPIVLLRRKTAGRIAEEVAPGCRTLGVMLPYTPLHHLLFAGAEFPALVMTSGNVSEEPIAFRNEDVRGRIHSLADHFLIHDRKIHARVDDSVVQVFEGKERVMRRARGYAPLPVDLRFPVSDVLAVGAELKNAFCLTTSHYAILSQHIGDMGDLETMRLFEETRAHMERFFRLSPRVIAHDLHPMYLTTKLALSMEGEKVGVQHHHAHIASCMAENHVRERVIGVAMDGTGYGTDGRIWGGEFLVCDFMGFERRGHFRYVPLAGGDAAVRQPWRIAMSYLRDSGIDGFAMPGVSDKERALVGRMIERELNTVETSSCGRLFDAVSAMLGVRLETTYEGQAAIELEAIAAEGVKESYPFDIASGQVDFRETMRAVARDVTSPANASARFHNTVAEAIVEMCRSIERTERLGRVCLSGGTFQNLYLMSRVVPALRAAGFVVYTQSRVPSNDGGLCLGQAVVAHAQVTAGSR